MRVWDIHPGYLNRQSLLGEHRELHGIVSILAHKKRGYASHPETIRWVGSGWALKMRHRQLACEMVLRGFKEESPVNTRTGKGRWPSRYIDSPEQQFSLLAQKYAGKEKGRIPLPRNTQDLWRHHKYSVLARDPGLYKEIGTLVSANGIGFADLSLILIESLRQAPTEGGVRNATQHMWGYVSPAFSEGREAIGAWPLRKLLRETQRLAMANDVTYLTSSTALSDLSVWLPRLTSR